MLQRRMAPANKWVRRTLQVIALVGTILIGIVALAVIVSQTPWFKDWLRRYVVREGNQYVNGTLAIGSLGGNLFTGVELGDVSLDVNGEHVITLKKLEVKYRLGELLANGITVDEIRLEQPFVLVRHDASGWNLAQIVRKQAQEADRQGPGRSISLPDIEIADGRAVIDDRAPSPSYELPDRIADLDVKAGFEYEPVHYSLTLDHLSFTGTSPDLRVANITGRVGTRDDDLHVENLHVQTADSSVTVDGAVRNYLKTPDLNITVTSPRLSLPEFAAVLPPLRGYNLHPSLDLKASGTQDNLQVTLAEQSEAGAVNASLTGDALAPGYAARGDVDVRNLNLAPLLKDPSQKSDITARTHVDLRVPTAADGAPALDRASGTFRVDAPRVVAAGYAASDVNVSGSLDGRRVNLDAKANAYGGSATAKGFVVTPASAGAPIQFDLAGSAAGLDLRNLPATLNAPRVATDINARSFQAAGEVGGGRTDVQGRVTMDQSTVAGGTITDGTSATFKYAVAGPRSQPDVSYTANGGVRSVNLYALGRAFDIAALAKPDYASRINADFNVTGSGTELASLSLDGTTTLTNTEIMGGTIPRLAVTAHLEDGAASGQVNGTVNGLDPSRITGNDTYKGTVNATLDTAFSVKDVTAPITPDSITADGRVQLADTTVAGVRIDQADIQGQYADRRGDIRQATITGPDLDITASGPIALDRTGTSNLKYHVSATDLAKLGKLAQIEGLSGSATVDGVLTGNAAELQATGTLDGSNLGYQQNTALDLNSQYTVKVPDLQFANAAVHAETTGTMIQAGGVKINDLKATADYANNRLTFQSHVTQPPAPEAAVAGGTTPKGPQTLDLSGTVEFGANGAKEIRVPNLAVSALGANWTTAPGAVPVIDYGDDRLRLTDVRFVNGNQSIEVTGEFPLDGNPTPGRLEVRAENVNLADVDRIAMLNRGIGGTLDAQATVTGTMKAPAVTGKATVADGAFEQFKYDSLAASADYANDTIRLDAKLTQAPGVELTATGTVPLSAVRSTPPGSAPGNGGTLDVRVHSSKIDLGIVQSFTTALTNVTGTLQADVRVTGTSQDPRFDGYVDVQGGSFAVPDAGTSFSGLSTRIELKPEQITVPQFEIRDEHDDTLRIGGQLAMHQRQAGAVHIGIESDNFKLMDNELGDVHVETHLQITGEARRPRIEGEIRMDQARLELDRILLQFASPYAEQALPEVVSASDTAVADQGAAQATQAALQNPQPGAGRGRARGTTPGAADQGIGATGALAPLALNVHLIVPDNLVARGQNLRPGGPTAMQVGNVNATLGADVQIRKQPDAPIVLRGTVSTIRGFYEFQGRRFTLQRGGTLRFLGLPQINPSLDVTADRLIPNTGVTATIHVTGTMRSPELQLSSSPPLDQADILSLIVFNRNVNELGSGERASLAETAGGIASGFIAAPLSRSVGRALDVDLFEITTTDPETGQSAGGVTLGKQVGDKAFVRFRQQFGQRSFTQFQVEYDLARFLRFEGSLAPETTSAANRLTQRRVERVGVDLIFFFSY